MRPASGCGEGRRRVWSEAVTDPSTGSGSWLTVSEAAARTGLHIDRLRSMIRRGKLEKRRGNRGEWLVLVPAEMMTGSDLVGGSAAGAADHANGSAEGDLDRVDGSVMSKLTDALTELAALEHELGAALTRSAVAEAEAATLRDALTKAEAMADQLRAEHRTTVAELRAELAEARRPWLAKVLEGLRRGRNGEHGYQHQTQGDPAGGEKAGGAGRTEAAATTAERGSVRQPGGGTAEQDQ